MPLNFSQLIQLGTSQRATRFLRSYHLSRETTLVKPLRLPSGYHSLLPLVYTCSNLVLPRRSHDRRTQSIATRTAEGNIVCEETVVPFSISHNDPVGFLRPKVASALEVDHGKWLASGKPSPWDLQYSEDRPNNLLSVAFSKWVNEEGQDSRTAQIARLISEWRNHNAFNEILRGWSHETYPVYTHPPKQVDIGHDPIAFAIERAALPLFGFLWIPRRSRMKRTWPGKLDVTTGGGMGLGDSAMETVIRESVEEARLDKNYLQSYTRPVGVLPFPNRSPQGWILPGLYYLFELPLPSDGSIYPQVNALDGEVEEFELMEAEHVLRCLLEGKFKASSALAVLDFLIRHGYVTEETDPRYIDVCRLLKSDIILPVAWRHRL